MTATRPPWLVPALLTAALCGHAGAETGPLAQRWVYLSTNLLVDANVDKAVALLDRAAKAGYNGVALADSKFMRWDSLPDRYRRNVARLRAHCRKRKLACIASVFPIGYSEGLLAHDPDLAAGLPVVGAPFVVRGRTIVPAGPAATLANPSFEQHRGHRPTGWRFADMPGKISFIDTKVVRHGKASLRMQDIHTHHPTHGNGRVMQTVKVQPFGYYHVSAWVKTKAFAAAGNVRIAVLTADGASLNHYQPRIRPTQDWRRVDITFNSLDHDEVRLYLGVWGGKGGTIWWDDVRIEAGGLVNLVRRKGAPLRITDAAGKTVYLEGRDFAGAVDPLLGSKPWAGAYSVWHTPPVMTVPAGSRLRDGQRVRVSYCHAVLVHHGQVMCCLAEPKIYEILAWQISRVRKHLAPDGYFMQHDEIRVQGWDDSCRRSGKTPGQLLAENVRRCAAIIRKADPGKPIYVWSDMFDPNHNARKTGRYYLVRGDGPWHGSWLGLPRDVVVVNWHGHKPGRAESLKFFAGRGHRQILAGYYDAAPERIVDWLADAAGVKGISGVMYTTWRSHYADLEAFLAAARRGVGTGKGQR